MSADIVAAFPEITAIAAVPIAGGQKEVFSGSLGAQKVALKLIKVSPAGDTRAGREVAAIEKLKTVKETLASTSVPRIIDSGARQVAGVDRTFIVEHFIDGENFRQVLGRNPVQSFAAVRKLVHSLVGACSVFESVAMVHRDINPRNIMLDTSGRYWVIDLGYVRHLDMTSATGDGAYAGVLGTPGYAPIEVLHNNKGEVDARADLFSIGVVAHEALSGKNAYTAGARDILEIFKRVETIDLPPLTIAGDVDGKFSAFVHSLTQRFPSRRPQTGKEALALLEDILTSYT